MPTCNSCHRVFPDYQSLALHIQASRKGHARSKKFAADFLLKNPLSAKAKNGKTLERIPITSEQREAREDTRRELSGDSELVITICPRCKRKERRLMEVEYTKSETALKIGSCIVVICNNCGGKR